ncbi:MAG: AAA family ATPase [Candidatus Marinimicrobia bacterium]|nr:AAA family ATPase [Candidatus Neomarinimicrobiota bacterium]
MEHSKITRLKLKNFTAFEELDMEFSPGINIFIGDNGTGKTHLLKLLYCISKNTTEIVNNNSGEFEKSLVDIFLPYERQFGRLRNNKIEIGNTKNNELRADLTFKFNDSNPSLSFYIHNSNRLLVSSNLGGHNYEVFNSVYIPVKEFLENAPGFLSLYDKREISFDKTYADILYSSFLPKKRSLSKIQENILDEISKIIGGRIISIRENFFLEDKEGVQTEFTLLAEGWRKLALLWLLIQNGSLFEEDSILFWDEPEANLNPKMKRLIIEILLELQKNGVQIFLATHDYVILKEFDLQKKSKDKIKFFSLYRDNEKTIQCKSSDDYLMIEPNLIQETFLDIYDRDIERALKSIGRGK